MEPPTAYVDLNFLERFTKGNKEKIVQYIKMYLKTAPQLFFELEELCSNQQWEELYVKAHSLKPQVLYMGISNLGAKLIRIEGLTKESPNRDELKNIVGQAIDLNEKAMVELVQYLNVVNS